MPTPHDPAFEHRVGGRRMSAALHTAVCDLLGCQYPIVLAGMGGVARAELVAAVSEAGGYGFLGMVREPPEFVQAQIRAVRALTRREFGVNLIPAATPPSLLDDQVQVCLEERVNSVTLFWGVVSPLIARLRRAGIIVAVQVGSVSEAEEAVEAGAHLLIVQGVGAGGHVRGNEDWRDLVPEVASRCDVPIVAAGGIVDGDGLAEAISLGAHGAMIGTAFLATDESFAHAYHKERILESRHGETLRTDSFHWNWPPGAPVRVLPNSVTKGERGSPYQEPKIEIGREDGRPIFLFSTDSPLRTTAGELEAMALYAGEGAAKIDRIVPAGMRLAAIVEQASSRLSAELTQPDLFDERYAFASSTCAAATANDAYMGFAPRDEILSVLNSLLEAKRGGARATIRLATLLRDRKARRLMHRIYRDDAESCQRLSKAIVYLGGVPSRKSGGVYKKLMASDGIFERLAVLRQGYDRAAERVRRVLPRVRNDGLYACLADMLRRQVMNMEGIDRLSRAEILD